MLGEFGDDPNRYTNAKSRKNYAGTSPLTIASGKKRAVLARHVRNRRLYDALDQWAFCALTASPGARAFYDQHRAAGDTHHQALRALGNRLVGILHGCLRHHTPYDEHTAWAHRHTTQPLDNLRPWDVYTLINFFQDTRAEVDVHFSSDLANVSPIGHFEMRIAILVSWCAEKSTSVHHRAHRGHVGPPATARAPATLHRTDRRRSRPLG